MVRHHWLSTVLALLQAGASSGFLPAPCPCPLPLPFAASTSRRTATANENEAPAPDESGIMADLRRRTERQQNQYARLLREQLAYTKGGRAAPETVHIIVFHPGTPQQTAHTIESPPRSGNNAILAFASGPECAAFARGLRDLEFADPSPEETMFAPFAEYCETSGTSLMIVPEGFDLTPPQINSADYDDDDSAVGGNDETATPTEKADDGESDAWG